MQTGECEMIRDLATDPKKRELFTRLAERFKILSADLERALPSRHDGSSGSQARDPLPGDVQRVCLHWWPVALRGRM
jgi:hypothetical protein